MARKILVAVLAIALFILANQQVFSQNKNKNDKDKNSKKDKSKDKDNNVNGIKWDVEITESGAVENARFRATPSNKIFLGATEIGTWEKIGSEKIKVNIVQGKLKGEMEITRVLNKPPTYGGKLKKPDGSEAKVKILFRDD